MLGSGPHVLRGIEIYKGRPIFYSLSNFIYQYRTPDKIPIDLIHQRDGEIERPTNVSVWDRRDPIRIFEGVVVRMTFHEAKLKRVESCRSPSTTKGRSTACLGWPMPSGHARSSP